MGLERKRGKRKEEGKKERKKERALLPQPRPLVCPKPQLRGAGGRRIIVVVVIVGVIVDVAHAAPRQAVLK